MSETNNHMALSNALILWHLVFVQNGNKRISCAANVRPAAVFSPCPTRRPRLRPAAPHAVRRSAPPAASAVVSSLNAFQTLQRHRNFRLFWIGQTVSLIGTWMQTMAQGWLALELSNSAFLVGVVASAGSLPVLALSLYAGVLADRVEKLRLVKIGQIAFCLQACALRFT